MFNRLIERGYRVRPATLDDIEDAAALFSAYSMRVHGTESAFASRIRTEWTTPGFDLETDTRLVLDADGQIAGYVEVWDVEEPHVRIRSWGRVHPDHWVRGIGSVLLEWSEQRAREAIPHAPLEARVTIGQGVPAVDEDACRLLAERGYGLVRHFLRMVRELDGPVPEPAWPARIEVRTLDPGSDLEATVRVCREAFRDHWGHVEGSFEQDLEQWKHWIAEDEDFDPQLTFLAREGGEIVGVASCDPKSGEDPQMGWVDILAVRKRWRRRGIALALLLHSFRDLSRRGKLRVGLGVDAGSLTGATLLYDRAGMRAVRRTCLYEKELRPGVDLSRRSLDEDEGSGSPPN